MKKAFIIFMFIVVSCCICFGLTSNVTETLTSNIAKTPTGSDTSNLGGDWVLNNGTWDDGGVWSDSETWND